MCRNGIKRLIQLKLSKYRKPLLILGARQVGKIWLLKEFGNTEYRPQIAIRTSLSDYKQESWMTNVPLYIIRNYFSEL
jgi:predicted AAA+ superfamily ATPase